MRELYARLKSRPAIFAEMIAASLLANVLALASPLFVIQVLNRYVAHGVDSTLATLAAGTVIAVALELGVPDAKIKFALNDMFAVYGDLGMGLSFQHMSVEVGAFSASDDTLSFTVQFGAGASYAITPNLNLLGEVRFNLYTRSGGTHTIAVPTVGVQYHP